MIQNLENRSLKRYIIEINVKKGEKNDIYSTSRGDIFLRMDASNRELKGSTLILYSFNKILT